MNKQSQIADLPIRHGLNGNVRRVGIELEFGGLPIDKVAALVGQAIGAKAQQIDPFRYTIDAAEGRYAIELDTRWAHPDFVAQYATDLPEPIRNEIADGVSRTAGTLLNGIFPIELVCPPIAYDQAETLRPVVTALADAGALGTAHSAISGFGMHINVEVANLEVEHLLSVTRAYLLLSFWLRRESRVAAIRHLQSYIEPFSEAYKRHVLAPDYNPDLTTFMVDHMHFNPTRNMELDLLPIFAVIDAERVQATLPGIKNSARPTFHWRLPNCRIDEPDWHPAQDWQRWVTVERLATDPLQLEQLSVQYLRNGPATEFEARVRRFFDLLRQ
jgi:hypothetical protein